VGIDTPTLITLPGCPHNMGPRLWTRWWTSRPGSAGSGLAGCAQTMGTSGVMVGQPAGSVSSARAWWQI